MALGFDCPDFLTPRLKDIAVPFFCMHGAVDEVAASGTLFPHLRVAAAAFLSRHAAAGAAAAAAAVGPWSGFGPHASAPLSVVVEGPAGSCLAVPTT